MARHMSCRKAPNPQANHALSVPPKPTVAIENVAEDAAFVGVTDFFHESICLLQLRREGSLPPDCGCDAAAPRQSGTRKRKSMWPTTFLRTIRTTFQTILESCWIPWPTLIGNSLWLAWNDSWRTWTWPNGWSTANFGAIEPRHTTCLNYIHTQARSRVARNGMEWNAGLNVSIL